MYKIKNKDSIKWASLGYRYDDEQNSFYKYLSCFYDTLNPKLGFGALFTYEEDLVFYESENYKNQFVNKDNFMKKIVDEEILLLLAYNMIEVKDEKII